MTHATSPQKNDQSDLVSALESAGIHVGARRFIDMVREALGDVRRTATAVAPAAQLTAPEIEQLRAGGFDPSADLAAFEQVQARTAARATALLASSLSVSEAARRLNVDQSRVRQLLAERALFGIKDGGEWRIPELQFRGDRVVPNLAAVIKALPEGIHPLSVINWLTTPEVDLEIDGHAVSPLDWLASGGDPAPVAVLAADL